MTIIEMIKRREQENRNRILLLLNTTDEHIAQFAFESAYQYLEKVFGTDAYGMEHLPMTSQFWAWWRKQWNDIDAIYLGALEPHPMNKDVFFIRSRDNEDCRILAQSVKDLRKYYRYYHQAHMNNVYLNSDIVRAAMHKMIKELAAQGKEAVNG